MNKDELVAKIMRTVAKSSASLRKVQTHLGCCSKEELLQFERAASELAKGMVLMRTDNPDELEQLELARIAHNVQWHLDLISMSLEGVVKDKNKSWITEDGDTEVSAEEMVLLTNLQEAPLCLLEMEATCLAHHVKKDNAPPAEEAPGKAGENERPS